MAVGYLLCAFLLAVTTSLTSPQGSNSIQTGITVVPDAARVIAQKSSPLLLNCSVIVDSDVGEVSFRWRRNGKLLPTLDSNRIQVFQNGSLYFKRVIHKTGRRRNKKRSDQGVYECLLRTQYGEAIIRRVYVLIPSIGKRFSQDPAPFTAYEGGVARFQCSITGVPPPIILWKKGTRGGQDDNFLESNTSKYVQLPHGVLHIRRVTREDEGEYRCLASRGGLINLPDVIDKIEWKDSQAAALTVTPAPAQHSPKVLAAPKNLTLELRGSGVMECLVDGQPMPSTEWTREGGAAIAASHVTEPGLLRFNLVKETDAGKYTCHVPELGISLTASLTINKPPMLVEKGPTSQQWAIMRTVRFECDVSGTPKPVISWYHNGTKITDGMSKITIKAKQLIIRHTGETDSGYYQCVAENSVGSINLLARLNVYIKEGMPETPQNLTGVAESSTSINLQWYQPQQANSEPILTNTIWFAHDAKSLRSQFVGGEGPRFSFTLTGLEPYTVYTVFIRSFNKVGASDSSKSIQVQTLEEVPMAAPKVNLSSPTPDTLRVTWEELAREESRGKVLSYRVFYRQLPHGPQVRADTVPASQREYLIKGLEPETDYGVRVEAATKLGFSNFLPEEAQWQLFKTGNKLGSVRDVVVEPVNSSAVRIQWQPGTGVEDVAIYSIELFGRSQGETTSLRTLEVAAPRTNVLLTGLDNATQYLVSIEAKSGQYRSKPAKEEFQTSALLPPVELRAERLSPSSLWVAWQQPPGIRASAYTVCYLAQATFTATPTSQWNCFESRMLNATVTNLQPFTKYVFSISAHAGKLRSPGSDFLNVQTLEDGQWLWWCLVLDCVLA